MGPETQKDVGSSECANLILVLECQQLRGRRSAEIGTESRRMKYEGHSA